VNEKNLQFVFARNKKSFDQNKRTATRLSLAMINTTKESNKESQLVCHCIFHTINTMPTNKKMKGKRKQEKVQRKQSPPPDTAQQEQASICLHGGKREHFQEGSNYQKYMDDYMDQCLTAFGAQGGGNVTPAVFAAFLKSYPLSSSRTKSFANTFFLGLRLVSCRMTTRRKFVRIFLDIDCTWH
jgi:hypothetical protein